MTEIPVEVDVSSYDKQFIKTVEKEGGKKGQDILGVSEMGGLQFFCTSIDTPDGDLALVNVCLNAMNKPVDEAAEERRGGAGEVGKMLFSSGVNQLAIVAKIPQADKINATEWMQHVANLVGGELVQPCNETYAQVREALTSYQLFTQILCILFVCVCFFLLSSTQVSQFQ
jgi:hypothetical protein